MSRLSEITQAQREQLRENAIKAQTSGLPFIRYDHENCKFMLGNTDVTDNDFTAVIDRCEAVWIYSQNSTVTELVRVNMMDGKLPPKPKGYDDQTQWEVWDKGKNKGKPKSPLWLQYELPLITDEDGRIIIFKASTKLTMEAVGRLLEEVNSQEKLRRPFATLEVKPNPDNVYQTWPFLTITDYSDDLEDVVLPGDKPKASPTNGSTSANGSGPPAPSRNSDMDDDIPFK